MSSILQKTEKHTFASMSLIVRDRAISSKFSTHRVSKKCALALTVRDRAISSIYLTRRVSKECTIANFQKNFPLPKDGGHFEFLKCQSVVT